MQHNQSAFIWEAVETLQFAQFPWRFLSLSIFSASLLGAFVLNYFKSYKTLIVWIIVIITVLLNWSFFQPREFYTWINDQNKLQDPLWEIQQKAGIMDYLPKTATEPHGRAPDNIEVLSGVAQGSGYNVRSNKFSLNIDVAENAYIQVPVFDFPDWQVYVNNQKIEHDNKSQLGRIGFNLTPGNYQVKGILKDTPARTAGNILTILSALVLAIIFFNRKIFKSTT